MRIEYTEQKIILHFDRAPIPPVKKALKENGFSCRKTIWSAKRTPQNEYFIKLLAR